MGIINPSVNKLSIIGVAVYSPMWPTKKSPGFGSFVKSFYKGISEDERIESIIIHTSTDLSSNKLVRLIDLIISTIKFFVAGFNKDIFYIHYMPITLPLIILVAKFLRKTIVVNLHGDELTEGGIKRSFIRFSSVKLLCGYKKFHIIVPSIYFEKLVPAFLNIYPPPSIFISPSGGVPDSWYSNKNQIDLPNIYKPLVVGYVGRIDSEKNWEIAFKLTQEFNKYNVSSKLILCGWGSDISKMNLVGLNSNIEWEHVPGVPRESLTEIYKKIDLLIFCSTRESLGLVGLEALASGVPVVAYSGYGQATYIKHKENGFLLSSEANSDVEELIIWLREYQKHSEYFSNKCVESSLSYREGKVSNDLVGYLTSLLIN